MAQKKVVVEEPEVQSGEKRVSTSMVLRPHTLAVYQRVVGLRAATGRTELTDAGFERPYSVSALMREHLEAGLPELEAELKKAGIPIPE